jgi:hypothetical protein
VGRQFEPDGAHHLVGVLVLRSWLYQTKSLGLPGRSRAVLTEPKQAWTASHSQQPVKSQQFDQTSLRLLARQHVEGSGQAYACET